MGKQTLQKSCAPAVAKPNAAKTMDPLTCEAKRYKNCGAPAVAKLAQQKQWLPQVAKQNATKTTVSRGLLSQTLQKH